uniref:VPS26, retromer complex component A n=1 Tax=Pavo cristatus TaxID=9049 RepID=A0A8C9L2K0_PAVCR
MSFLGGFFGPVCEIDVILNDAETRKTAEMKTEDGKVEKHFLFYDGESVSGKVNVSKQHGKRLEHQGIRIEFVGQIELFNDKSNTHEFVNLVKELALPGELTQSRSYDFEFMQVEKPYESYIGANVRLRYFLKVTIVRRLSDIVKEYDLIVHQLATYPDVNNSIKMEVGIEDCLHIEFEYNKSKYHLKDVIVGKIYFLLVRIKIQHMELQLIKKEITGIGKKNKIQKGLQLVCQLSLVQTWRMKSVVAALAELMLSVLFSHWCLTTTCIFCRLYLTPEQCHRRYECWASSTDLNHCKWSSCRNMEELKQS